jgi:uncharacterized protein (DUF697 family)
MIDDKLMEAAFELGKAANKLTDQHFPERIADIVKLHAGIAVGAGFIPIPGADMVAAAGNIWAMYARINSELDMPFTENVMKSVAMGVVTNIGAGVVAAIVAGSFLKLIPGLGTVGGIAVVGATIYGVTLLSGYVYMRAVAELLTRKSAGSISEADLKAATADQMKNKSAMRDFVKEAAKGFKPGDKA